MSATKKTEPPLAELRAKKQLWLLFIIIFIMLIVGLLAFNRQVQKVGREAEELKSEGRLPSGASPNAKPL
ncbi:MAG: hypothetical protein A2017_19710 [Lentisphaerae bacterium GWF2_44_16]|nr:MAG: hypothetical protein A2017_19710 [Lentisphaerae bacterium GWF2_44_16]